MDFLTNLWDSTFALCVGVVFGVLVDRLGVVDWLMAKILRK
tara:strand:+ start:281 stop:403 length:123 start_codon:yes stop_codon:yes gene_type:complete